MNYTKPVIEKISTFKRGTAGLIAGSFVLEHGRLVGSGTHEELLSSVPLYKELAKEQFLS